MEKMHLGADTANAPHNGQDESSKVRPPEDTMEDTDQVMEHSGETIEPTAGTLTSNDLS